MSTLARMAGNIASGLVFDGTRVLEREENADAVARVAVDIAEQILALIELRHPDPDSFAARHPEKS